MRESKETDLGKARNSCFREFNPPPSPPKQLKPLKHSFTLKNIQGKDFLNKLPVVHITV
jgi:hypothetical protein